MALYVRHVVRRLIAEGWRVSLLTTRDAVAHPAFSLVKAEASDRLPIYFLPPMESKGSNSAFSLIVEQFKKWRILRREFQRIAPEVRADVIYVPTMDWIAKAIELIGSPFGDVPFVGLYMAVTHHRKATGLGSAGRQDWLYDILFRRLLRIRTLKKVLVIDAVFFDFAQNRYKKWADKIEYVSDFGEIRGSGSKEESRKELGIPRESLVLLVYGSLTYRKGIRPLLKALASPELRNRIVVVLAGSADSEIATLLEEAESEILKKNGMIISRLFFHNQPDEYMVFRSADFVWLGYTGAFYGSSGVLYQALSAGLPVVAMDKGLIGHIVRAHGLGVTVDPSDPAEIVKALVRISAVNAPSGGLSKDARRFAKAHTGDGHRAAVLRALRLN